jgi:hypothetical protein
LLLQAVRNHLLHNDFASCVLLTTRCDVDVRIQIEFK